MFGYYEMANWVKSVPGGRRSTNELAWHPAYVPQPLSFISACVVWKPERSKVLLSDSMAALLRLAPRGYTPVISAVWGTGG